MSLQKYSLKTEIKRKIVHVMSGLSFAIPLYFEFLTKFQLEILLITFSLLSFFASLFLKKFRPKFIMDFISHFERPINLKRFPLKSVYHYFVGMFFVIFLFRKDIATASILILAFGDPISHIVGKMYGKRKVIVHSRKLLEGTLAGIVAGTFAASFVVHPVIAFFGAMTSMMVEAVEINIYHFDDNCFIPAMSGIVMSLIMSLI